jgi:hypothetical protein
MEAMGVRVLSRHLSLLPGRHPTAKLLRAILRDERRHVSSCEEALGRLLRPGEEPALEALFARIDGVERAFGISGSLALLGLGLALWAKELLLGKEPPPPCPTPGVAAGYAEEPTRLAGGRS